MNIIFQDDWKPFFESQSEKTYFKNLLNFLESEYKSKTIFPPEEKLFRIFQLIKPSQIKVIIIGQDPYHGLNQANGIAFSCENNNKIPPSLRNIFKELLNDLKIDHFDNLDLSDWVEQGVFLINSVMSVEAGKPASHKNQGWEEFTINVLEFINEINKNLIYCLWGNFAKRIYNKVRYKNTKKVEIISSGHPSPFSYHLYQGSRPFSKINDLLVKSHKKPIKWGNN
ncbi:uracil-DNA glycosylase [Spiroplasma sabaudiense Ar-1343]|uniref:Uracil-DNA glycosylase n=1 Tax=Spiroplasma sabaudiense Ar-1343 TaxID=1276257 RepID=W6A8Z9_9MOLU|nr:uracil-DNA glycosylase [Spiroplasma sabaudiense]AHI53441.1 uracil-DNA glycosylase [Spiroplasma sabaudiense Ar-1343]